MVVVQAFGTPVESVTGRLHHRPLGDGSTSGPITRRSPSATITRHGAVASKSLVFATPGGARRPATSRHR
jgi:hypothetical protein